MMKRLFSSKVTTKYNRVLTAGIGTGELTASRVTEISLKQIRRGIIKRYILTIGGFDNQAQLPNHTPREFQMEFMFCSIYGAKRIQDTLDGATRVEFIKTLRRDMPLMSFSKKDDDYIMNHTTPISHNKSYMRCNFLDFVGDVFVKDAATVTFPEGLKFTA